MVGSYNEVEVTLATSVCIVPGIDDRAGRSTIIFVTNVSQYHTICETAYLFYLFRWIRL